MNSTAPPEDTDLTAPTPFFGRHRGAPMVVLEVLSCPNPFSMAEKAVDASRYRWVVLAVVWPAFLLSYVDRVAWSSSST